MRPKPKPTDTANTVPEKIKNINPLKDVTINFLGIVKIEPTIKTLIYKFKNPPAEKKVLTSLIIDAGKTLKLPKNAARKKTPIVPPPIKVFQIGTRLKNSPPIIAITNKIAKAPIDSFGIVLV